MASLPPPPSGTHPPVLATAPQPTAPPPLDRGGIMPFLSPYEQSYVKGLKRKERSDLARVLKRPLAASCTPLRVQVLQSDLPDAVKVQIFNELRAPSDKYVTWVKKVIQLPMGRLRHPDFVSLPVREAVARAQSVMDSHISGHSHAKREVLKMVCQMQAGGTCGSAYSIGLEGPPGTGKTYFAKEAIPKALDRKLVTIPLGGATDVSFMLGHIYTYEGAKEGRLAAALMEAKCANPVIFFDEVDKISHTEKGAEIVSTLIHLIDPSANACLRDRYLHGIDLDFSKCTFVFSYNDPTAISPILLDRIKRISMPSPTDEERSAITRTHILPRAQRRLNTHLGVSEEALGVILGRACGGMRGVEKDLDHVLAAAQLCVLCDDVTLAGLEEGTKVLDAQSLITSEFACGIVASLSESPYASPPPPAGMYT